MHYRKLLGFKSVCFIFRPVHCRGLRGLGSWCLRANSSWLIASTVMETHTGDLMDNASRYNEGIDTEESYSYKAMVIK